MGDLHCLRPLWLWAFGPLLGLMIGLLWLRSAVTVWSKICDAHLLQALLIYHGRWQRLVTVGALLGSLSCLILALAGPTWSKIAVPTYQHLNPHMILLDLSSNMLQQDISPDRLTRAKFKIHDLLKMPNAGQFGLMVYSSEPFLVSPLTDDAQTIDILLTSLSPEILPVDGNHLERALTEAKSMFKNMGFRSGDILVLSGQIPSAIAVDTAQKLAEEGYSLSVIPITGDKSAAKLFDPLATAGHGERLVFSDTNADIQQWLSSNRQALHRYQLNQQDDVPIWRDQGRWFLALGLLFFLPLFRRGWFERIGA